MDLDTAWTQWRNLIGEFIMEFSEIEFISHSLWKDKIGGQVIIHNFKDRTRQVISKLSGKDNAGLKELLERSVELADKRNTVAHNPSLIQVFQHAESNEFNFEYAISSFSQKDYIDLAEMKELVSEVTDIKTDIYMWLGYIPQNEVNKKLDPSADAPEE